MVEKAVYALLTGDADVSGLVGLRVFNFVAPLNTFPPLVTFEREDTNHAESYVGSAGFASATIAISAWDRTLEAASVLAEHIRDLLQNVSTQAAGGVTVRCIHLIGESTDYEQVIAGDEGFLYAYTQSYVFWFSE